MSVVISMEQLVARAKKQRAEIEQIFLDMDHWNRSVRKAHETVIDPDPEGALERARATCNSIIREFEAREQKEARW